MIQKKILMACTIIGGMLSPIVAVADDHHHGYGGHYSVYGEKFVNMLKTEQKLELHNYLNYEHREPCQNYRPVPEGFYKDGCELKYRYPETPKPVKAVVPVPEPEAPKVLNSYKVYFDFDKYNLTSSARDTLDRVADEICYYKPSEVTIAGHADRSGPADYNYDLSRKRAEEVSQALTMRGVVNRVIDREAYGESRPAVETGDGVRMPENRRVTIDFMK